MKVAIHVWQIIFEGYEMQWVFNAFHILQRLFSQKSLSASQSDYPGKTALRHFLTSKTADVIQIWLKFTYLRSCMECEVCEPSFTYPYHVQCPQICELKTPSNYIWRKTLNTYHAGFGFTAQNCSCFLTFLKFWRLFHELMNQYQACLYLSQCIFHCGFKYGHEILQFLHFYKFWYISDLSSALTCRVESIKITWHSFIQFCHDFVQLCLYNIFIAVDPVTNNFNCAHQTDWIN